RPGGGYAAVMAGRINAHAYDRVWVSEDGGETWGPDSAGVPLPEGPPDGVGGGVHGVLALGGPSAFVVLGRGTVYRTDDAGATWEAVGRAPEIAFLIHLSSAAVGPDGRLYVGLTENGTARAWVWRTAEAVTVAAEPGLEPSPEGLGLEVHPNPSRGEATVTLTLARPSEVEVAVYDVLGRRVAAVASGPYPAGTHGVPLAAGPLPAGVYVVRVAAGGTVAARTVTLLD
ncbi:MAG TPA: T9SS type A sorting domain-containing protein, partial [Rubricoccaceae bacterium]|nr:T9SS type A sorting domain-containing protein [Rubricoccaceae bacterium]